MFVTRATVQCIAFCALSVVVAPAEGAGPRWRLPSWLRPSVVRSQSPEPSVLQTSGSAATGEVVYSDGPVYVEEGLPHAVPAYSGHVCATCEAGGDCSESQSLWERLCDGCKSCRRKLYFCWHRKHHKHKLYPVCTPFNTPNHGYYPTCWRRTPEFNHCPPAVDIFTCPPELADPGIPQPYLAPPPTPSLPMPQVDPLEDPPAAPPAPEEPELPEITGKATDSGSITPVGFVVKTRQDLLEQTWVARKPAAEPSRSEEMPEWYAVEPAPASGPIVHNDDLPK